MKIKRSTQRSIQRSIRHMAICMAAIALLVGVPFIFTEGFSRLINGTDAVSGASVIIDKPSGNFIVLINRDMHKKQSDMDAWHEFFSGGDFSIIFDDISCVTLEGDSGALEMARSFMSRLPENQMKTAVNEAVLTLSKAELGRFDMMIISNEAADAYGISSVYEGKNVDVIHLTGENT